MVLSQLANWVVSSLLLGLRIAPVFAFAPPFTLVPMPRLFRVLLGLGISVCLVGSHPQTAILENITPYSVFLAAAREIMISVVFVLVFQLAFASLYVAGRTVDIQAGYGLALLIDPATQSQTPLVGTLFALTAGAAFYGLDGHIALYKLFAASLDSIPLGSWTMPMSLDRLTAFISLVFLTAFGAAGGIILALFLVDLSIATLSRTVPQMNVLVLGFQVKTLVLLLILPLTFGVGGALFARIIALALEEIPRIL